MVMEFDRNGGKGVGVEESERMVGMGGSGGSVSLDTNHGSSLAYLKSITLKDSGNEDGEVHPSMIGKLEKARAIKRQLSLVESGHQILPQQMQLSNALMQQCDKNQRKRKAMVANDPK